MTCQPLGVPREGPAAAHLPDGQGRHLHLYGRRCRRRIRRISRHPDRRPPARPGTRVRDTYLGDTVGRWEGDTLVLDSIAFVDHDVARARRLLPLRPDACGREIHASGRCDLVRRDGRRSRGARGAVGVADADGAAQPESRRGPDPRARQLRSVRNRGGRHADSPLTRGRARPSRPARRSPCTARAN